MKGNLLRLLFTFYLLLFTLFCAEAQQRVLVGMTDTAAYFPLLAGRRVAVLANHTSVADVADIGACDGCGSLSDRICDACSSRGSDSLSDRICSVGSSRHASSLSRRVCGDHSSCGSGSDSCPGVVSDIGSVSIAPCDALPAVAVAGSGAILSASPANSLSVDREGRVHLVDLLHARGFDVTAIFSPEHGFRGTADAGERVSGSVDARTGIPIRSLYDGASKRPSAEAMGSFDVLVVDMQDVGLRFYTYYISMLRMMDACAEYGLPVVVLDRPNPNGDKVDGPVLETKYRSGVGALPVPVLHGLTMGEIARMAVGEGWAAPCRLTVVPCRNYTHSTEYLLPVAPSPNLPTQRAVYLYASLCLFEGTPVSVGRGTEKPFEVYGHPALKGYPHAFTPRSSPGAKHPPLEGKRCCGEDLSALPLAEARRTGLSLKWLMGAFRDMDAGEAFFTPMFEKLVGTGYVREMMLEGASEECIRARWQDDLDRYSERRKPYLLYD